MSDPNHSDNSNLTDDTRNQSFKQTLSKFEYDLYHEEDDIAERVIRVKRVGTSDKNEKWKIFQDNKVVFILDGSKLTKKEREFLRTVEGVSFLIAQAKGGIKSFNKIRAELKQKIVAKSK